VDEAFFLCRLLQFASAMLLFGISVFQWSVAPVGMARALDQSLRRASKVAAIVLFATAIAWLLLTAGEMGEGWADAWNPSVIGSVILYTDFGRVWLWRLGAVVVLLAVLTFTRDNHWSAVALLGALALGSLGLVGHAVMRAGMLGWLNKLSQIMHLLATGFWLGSLVPLVASLRLTSDPNISANARVALRNFSGLGHIAVVTVLATGGVNTWLVLGVFPIGVSSPYQALLLAKIVLVAIMLALALANRYLLLPRFDSGSDAVRLLRWSAIGEIIIGLGAVGLVSAIGILPPT
jgi:putative copper resistance protein D